MDEALPGAEVGDGPAVLAGAELGAIVGHHALQPHQPRSARSWATQRANCDVQRTEGLRGVVCSSAQVYSEPTSTAVYGQTVPLVPERRPT